MLPSNGQVGLNNPKSAGTAPAPASRALEWLWQYFQDTAHPRVLDCGPVSQATVNVLLRRGAKLYVADLISPLQQGEPSLWDRSGKHPVFLPGKLLVHVAEIPRDSLSVIFCWHLLDLLPREPLPVIIEQLCSYLRPGGVLFCILREPHLRAGAETAWWLESLMATGNSGEGREAFRYPALTNREMERLVPSGTVKTFLTRSGRREVLAVK